MIKFFASIPKSYIESVPPGRYLINAAQFYTGKYFQLPNLPRDGYTWMIDSGGYQFRDGYPAGYVDKYVQFIQDLQLDFAVFPDVMGDAKRTLELFEYTDKIIDKTLKTVWLPVLQSGDGKMKEHLKYYNSCCHENLAIGGLKNMKDFSEINDIIGFYQWSPIHLLGAGLKILKKIYTSQEMSCDSGNFNQRFGKNIQKCNDYMRLNNCTQKEAIIRCMLPEYIKKVEEL
jgi:hypothetical protein